MYSLLYYEEYGGRSVSQNDDKLEGAMSALETVSAHISNFVKSHLLLGVVKGFTQSSCTNWFGRLPRVLKEDLGSISLRKYAGVPFKYSENDDRLHIH